MKFRILIADDHPAMREGLAAILSVEDDFEVCGKASSVSEALDLARNLKPDLVITDLAFPERSGLELVKDLKILQPETPVIVMSMHDETIYAERVFRAGGRGYLMKESSSETIIEAVRKILKGGVWASQKVTDLFLYSLSWGAEKKEATFPLKRLTDRELEVFESIGKGGSSQDIADSLNISARTVDAHRAHIREKLGITDSTELTRYAVRWIESGTISPLSSDTQAV